MIFTNNDLSALAALLARTSKSDPLVFKLATFLEKASDLGGMSLVNVKLIAEIAQ